MYEHFILAGVAVLLLAKIYKIYRRRQEFLEITDRYPGPKPLPFVGNALDFSQPTLIIPCFMDYMKTHGDIFKVQVGFNTYLELAEADIVEFFLSSSKFTDKCSDYTFAEGWLGDGLITSSGNVWRHHRKMITPSFHFSILDDFSKLIDSCGNVLIEKLREKTNEKSVDVYPLVTLCALDIIFETAMGVSIHAQEDSKSVYVEIIKDMATILGNRIFTVKKNDFLYKFTDDCRREKGNLHVLHGLVEKIIRNKRSENLAKPKNGKMALLDLLLHKNEDGEVLTDESIKYEVNTFLFAGHDTVASTVSFAIHCLAENPDVQERVFAEQQSIFPTDRPVTTHDLNQMKYLEKVIKETLRLFPPVPIIARKLNQDINYNGLMIPKEVSIGIFIYGLHRNPKYFPDPDRFEPERFSPENRKDRKAYSYVPFSAGPRNCIGQRFAMMSMKTTLSKIVRNFRISSVNHGIVLSADVVMKSANGMCVKLTERN